jgi:hypothetical protein
MNEAKSYIPEIGDKIYAEYRLGTSTKDVTKGTIYKISDNGKTIFLEDDYGNKSTKPYRLHDLKNLKINEARVQLKRKYGIHPPHVVSSHAPLRERVLGFVKEKGEVSEEEINTYIGGLREETGKEGSTK